MTNHDSEIASLQGRADDLASQADWSDAAAAVNRRLIELATDRVVAYTRLARCLKARGDIEAAEALYRRVLDIDPTNAIASNNIWRLKKARQAMPGVDTVAAKRATARPGTARPVHDGEMHLLVEACRGVLLAAGDYNYPDYITNVLLTVLDLRMHNEAVDNSIGHYWSTRWTEIRTIGDLEQLLASHPDDRPGNVAVAQYLWDNNHWMRVEWLRGFVSFLVANDLITHDALRAWAHDSDFHRDFEGRVRNLGIAAYKWLTMRLGVETVKPDAHLHNFVERVVGHPITDGELVRVVEHVARDIGLSPRQLDASIWEFQQGGPETA
jgi:hypothetical protein